MSSGERDGSHTSTPRSRMGGRRAWLGLGFAAVVLAAGGAIANAGRNHDHPARALFAAVDPLDAAAKDSFYAMNPPVGDLVVLADRSAQPGVPQRRRFSL